MNALLPSNSRALRAWRVVKGCIMDPGETYKKPGWESLPQLALIHIFSYLSLQERLGAARVCLTWSQALQSPSLWHRISVFFDNDFFTARPEPLYMAFARSYGQFMKRLSLTSGSPPIQNTRACARAIADYLYLLKELNLQLSELILAEWFFSSKWVDIPSRKKIVLALVQFLNSQKNLQKVSLQNAHLGLGEGLGLLNALTYNSGHSMEYLNLRSSFKEWQVPHQHPRYIEFLSRLTALHELHLNYPALSDSVLTTLAKTANGILSVLWLLVRGSENRHHEVSDASWRALIAACPALRVNLTVANISHHEDLAGFLLPSMPIRSFRFYSGSVWDQSRSRNFRQTVLLLLDYYTQTLEEVHLRLKNNKELMDDLLIELLNQCSHLSNLHFEGVLRDMETVRKICQLQMEHKIDFHTVHVTPRSLTEKNRLIVDSISEDYKNEMAENSISFSIDSPEVSTTTTTY